MVQVPPHIWANEVKNAYLELHIFHYTLLETCGQSKPVVCNFSADHLMQSRYIPSTRQA